MLYTLSVKYFNYGDTTNKPTEICIDVIGIENAVKRMKEFSKAENFIGCWLIDNATGEFLEEIN